MAIFTNESGKLKKLNPDSTINERFLQNLIEQNLSEVLDMHFLASEYIIAGGRIDTLAIDFNGSPVIIEYKRNRNDNVINQALSYLRWLKSQKSEFFEMLVIKRLGKEIADKLDWNNPRVICIAESYSKFDIDTAEVIPMRLELHKYRYYEHGILSLEPINVIQHTTTEKRTQVSDIDVKHDLRNTAEQLKKADDPMQDLFSELRMRILEMDENIIERTTSAYTAYRVSKNFVELTVQKKGIRLLLRPINYNDPKNLVVKIPDSHMWTLDRKVTLSNINDLDYIMTLIEQSYKNVL